MKCYIVLLSLLLLPIPALSFYKCTNAQGEATYQKIPCSSETTQKKVHVFNPPQPGVVKGSEFINERPLSDESSMILRSKLGSVLASLSPVKTDVIQYYRTTGVWPKSLAEIGLNKDEMKSSNIDEVILQDEGGIVAMLNSEFGENKQIVLVPKSVMSGTSIEWQCVANFSKQVLSVNGHAICESRLIN